jgi:hypothetical protein
MAASAPVPIESLSVPRPIFVAPSPQAMVDMLAGFKLLATGVFLVFFTGIIAIVSAIGGEGQSAETIWLIIVVGVNVLGMVGIERTWRGYKGLVRGPNSGTGPA